MKRYCEAPSHGSHQLVNETSSTWGSLLKTVRPATTSRLGLSEDCPYPPLPTPQSPRPLLACSLLTPMVEKKPTLMFSSINHTVYTGEYHTGVKWLVNILTLLSIQIFHLFNSYLLSGHSEPGTLLKC